MLATRLAEGCPLAELGPAGRAAAATAVADGLADPVAYEAGRLALTTRGPAAGRRGDPRFDRLTGRGG